MPNKVTIVDCSGWRPETPALFAGLAAAAAAARYGKFGGQQQQQRTLERSVFGCEKEACDQVHPLLDAHNPRALLPAAADTILPSGEFIFISFSFCGTPKTRFLPSLPLAPLGVAAIEALRQCK